MINRAILIVILSFLTAACSTTGRFKIPEGSQLYLGGRPNPVVVRDNGLVVTRPYFWNNIAGIKYRVEKDGQIIKQGKVSSRFRVASIFWPPYAVIYWPVGFNRRDFNDLTVGLMGIDAPAAVTPAPVSTPAQ